MGLHFHNWIDYNEVTFLAESLKWVAHFRDLWDKKILVIRDLKIGRFAVKKWFLLLFLILNSRLALNSVLEITT